MNDEMDNGRVSDTILAQLPVTTTPVNRHLPVRPGWTCVVDESPWPCPGARVHLRAEYADNRTALAVYMSQRLMAAATDIGDQDALPPDLFDRFMAWT